MTMAKAAKLDLIEISPNTVPPVCKIADFGKFRYEIEKKEKTKLFFTVNFEASKWRVKSENVVMIVFSQGDQVLALSLLYDGGKK